MTAPPSAIRDEQGVLRGIGTSASATSRPATTAEVPQSPTYSGPVPAGVQRVPPGGNSTGFECAHCHWPLDPPNFPQRCSQCGAVLVPATAGRKPSYAWVWVLALIVGGIFLAAIITGSGRGGGGYSPGANQPYATQQYQIPQQTGATHPSDGPVMVQEAAPSQSQPPPIPPNLSPEELEQLARRYEAQYGGDFGAWLQASAAWYARADYLESQGYTTDAMRARENAQRCMDTSSR